MASECDDVISITKSMTTSGLVSGCVSATLLLRFRLISFLSDGTAERKHAEAWWIPSKAMSADGFGCRAFGTLWCEGARFPVTVTGSQG